MNLKKSMLVLGLFPLLLSCSKTPYVGEYVFQMGKSKDTHIGVSLSLTNDDYDASLPEKGKKFSLSMDIASSIAGDSEAEPSEDSSESEEKEYSLIDIVQALSPVEGFYNIDKNNKVYNEKRLNLGISFLGQIELPQSVMDLIFVASISGSTVNFYLPVSIEDLSFQLYWYGYDLSIDAFINDETGEIEPIETAEGPHPVGTHPTQEDIDLINQHYPNNHSGVKYRDYHVLKLGLTKK